MKKFFFLASVLPAAAIFGCGSSSSETCGPGTVDNAGACVVVDAGTSDSSTAISCGAGTVLVGGACVPVDSGPSTTCGDGTFLDGGVCVPVDSGPGIVCGPGTVLDGGSCVIAEAGPSCGDGTVLDGGSCVPVDAAAPVTVTVNLRGPGTGSVSAPGMTCVSGVCSVAVLPGTAVTLTATPDTGWAFAGWNGGGCSGTSTCVVTPTTDVALMAGFSGAAYYVSSSGSPSYDVALNGGTARPIFPNTSNFAVSADGMTFAFQSPSTNTQIWVEDFWSGTASVVENNARFPSPFAGSVSPDNKKIALWVTTSGQANLRVVNIDGTSPKDITSYTSNLLRLTDCHNADCATTRLVAWSPDSTQLAWVATAPLPTTGDAGIATSWSNIWIANADGTGAKSLTSFTHASVSTNPQVAGLDWSLDGTKIAFVANLKADPEAGTAVSNLWTVNVSTSALTPVTSFTTEYGLDMATYVRAGGSLVFSALKDPAGTGAITTRNLFSVKEDGTSLTAITSFSSGSVNEGQYWAADGATLIYESNQDPTDATKKLSSDIIYGVKPGSAPVALTTPSSNWDYSPLDDND